jgi:hypothetical protein
MIIGFTGTRHGMSEQQKRCLDMIFNAWKDFAGIELHHGDCIGSDAEAHKVAESIPRRVIIVHPPIKDDFRAYCHSDQRQEPKDYIERDHDIVNRSDFVVAAPKGFTEEVRSGTWATIRYAKTRKIPFVVLWPDGGISYNQWKIRNTELWPDGIVDFAAKIAKDKFSYLFPKEKT